MKNKKFRKATALALTLIMTFTVLTTGTFQTVMASAASIGRSDSTPPDKPDGDSDSSTPPDKPDGESGGTSGGSTGGGSSSSVTSWDAVTEYSSDTTTSGKTYTSTGTDENAIHVSGGKVVLNNPTVTRTSSDSTGGDNSSFYGVGAAILTTDGTTYVNGGTVTTDSKGGAGIFSYGDGVTYVSGTTIDTAQSTSGGIHVAGGGTLYAWDVTAETEGGSSAAIRSDRGGGTMVIDGGSYTSNGSGSPAVYCTADITVNDADLVANGSEGVCIEGLNSLRLFDCDLTSAMPDDSQNDTTWSVILYQSQSGDSQEGNSTYEMVGGSLTSKNGGLFYTTNTESTFYISDVDITAADDCEFFLMATGNNNSRGWGSSGSNGADCSFTADNQVMNGDVIWDSISQLDFYMLNGSTLTGAVLDDESYAGNGGSGYCNLYISSDSTWIVTGNSTVTKLYNAGTIVDADGKTVTIKGTDGTVYVNGTSAYTVTVTSYSTSADFSGCSYATSTPAFASYAVTKPSELTATSSGSTDTGDTDDTDDTDDNTATVSAVINAEGGNVDYRTKVTLKASATGVPTGCYVAIYDGSSQLASGTSSVSYSIGEMKSDKTYSVRIVDANGVTQTGSDGNALSEDVTITVNDGVFQKIIAFFRGIFNALPSATIGQ